MGYEIVQSHNKNNGMLGIYINNLKDTNSKTDTRGKNPFTNWQIEKDGKKMLLSEIYPTYDNPILMFIIVLLIGIVVGVAAQRMAPASWLSSQIAGGRRADLTSALVGVAGAFIGFHIAALVALSAGMIVLFIATVIGAALVVWGWREIKL